MARGRKKVSLTGAVSAELKKDFNLSNFKEKKLLNSKSSLNEKKDSKSYYTISIKKLPGNKIYTGTTFNIAYHQLKKDAFNYSNSDYPELRREYAIIFNNYNQREIIL